MASYVEILPGHEDYPVLTAVDSVVRKYVVVWTAFAATVRSAFGVYPTIRRAFAACSRAKLRRDDSRPLCYLYMATHYFRVIANNEFTH